MAEPKRTGKKAGKKKRPPPVYVPVAYPVWLGVGSFAWAVVGWLIAAFAPRLAFVPAAGALHLVFPAVTVGLLGVNLFLAVRNLLRGAHVLRLAVVTGIEIALFTTLFFQLYAHVGAELYDAPGETRPWQWVQFSAAHAFRAGDVFDAVEAYGWGIQPVKHTSPLVGVFVVAYHVVVDVFFLGLVWAAVGRFREAVLADDEFRGLLVRVGLAAFAVWFLTWFVVAFFYRPWRFIDIPLWFLENVVRVVDFADVMESFGVRFHTLPREGIVGTLTLFCRLWIGIGLAFALTRKRTPPVRRVLTPPGVEAGPYWRLRAGALAGMAVGLFVVGVVGWLAAGRPAEGLAAAVNDGPEGRSRDALRALRRMGPAAGAVAPDLVAARTAAPPAVRDDITRTLGYLGTTTTAALRQIALAESPESAAVAVEALAAVGGPAAPDLVAVWDGTTAEPVRDRADAALRQVGAAGVAPLIDGFTADNAFGHYQWLQRLDPNWRLRDTTNPMARACQGLPDLLRRVNGPVPADAAAAMNEMKACGSAAKIVLDFALDRLGDRDPGMQGAAAGIVTATGPTLTPRVLRAVAAAGEEGPLSGGVLTVLSDAGMWTDAVYAEPNTLPALLTLTRRADGFVLAVRHLGHYGPAAAAAAPVLIPKVGDPDEFIRATARTTLARIHPTWKADPALTAALPTLLYQLPQLPKDESDELYAALGDIPPAGASAVHGAISKKLREVNDQYRGRGVWDKTAPERYTKALDDVYGPVERLGSKAKALAPGFSGAIGANAKVLNDPKPPIVTARLLRTLPLIGTLIDADGAEKKLFGLRAAAALGRDAGELVPKLLAGLPKANVTVQPRFDENVWLLARLTETLTAVDPDWWGRAEALAGFTALLAAPEFETPEAIRERQRLLDLFAAGPRAAALTPKVAAALLARGAPGRTTRAAFDKLDPKWRDDADVKAEIPTVVDRLFGLDHDPRAELLVVEFGAAAAPALAARLDGIPDAVLAAPANSGEFAKVRDGVVATLVKIGPGAKAATPTLLKMMAKSQLDPGAAVEVVAALDKTDPGWDKAAEHKAAVAAAGQAFLKRAAEAPQLLIPAGRCGVDLVPELTRRLAAAPSPAHKAEVLMMANTVGRAAKGLAPTVAKLVTDKEQHPVVRQAAIAALGRVGAGDPAWGPTLFPGVSDPELDVRTKTGQSLDQVDPEWRAKPAAKQAGAAALKQLADPSPRKRYDAVGTLDLVRPPDAAAALERLVAGETDLNTKRYAEQVLGRLRKAP